VDQATKPRSYFPGRLHLEQGDRYNSEATNLGVSASSGGDTNITGNAARDSRGLFTSTPRHRLTFFGTYNLPFWRIRKDSLTRKGCDRVRSLAVGRSRPWSGYQRVRPLRYSIATASATSTLMASQIATGAGGHLNTGQEIQRSTRSVAANSRERVSHTDCRRLWLLSAGPEHFLWRWLKTVDLGIYRTFRMPWENHRILFRADLFNAFNHVQYSFPNPDLASSTLEESSRRANQYGPRVVHFRFAISTEGSPSVSRALVLRLLSCKDS